MALEIVPRLASVSRAASDAAGTGATDGEGAQGDGDGGTAVAVEPIVRVAISSETPVRRYWGREVLVHTKAAINPAYLDAGMAVLTDHDTGRHIGILRNYAIDADHVLRGDACFDPEDPEAMRVYSKVQRGFLRFTSVGYSIERYTLVSEDEDEGNTYHAERWTPLEVSFVAVPADITVGADRSSGRTLVRVPIALPDPASPPVPPPAAQARSFPVPEQNTAAPAAVSLTPVGPSREQRLTDLAVAHQRTIGELQGWISSGRSVDEVSADLLASFARAAAPAIATPQTPAVVTNVHDRAADQPFGDFGEFVTSLIRAGRPQGTVDPRLHHRAATGAGSDVGSDGGFLIPPGFSAQIVQRANVLGDVWSRVTKVPVMGNSMIINGVDETSRANGSRFGGISVVRAAEGDTTPGTKTKFYQVSLKLKKLLGLFYVTEEQQEDGPAAAEIAMRGFSEELVFATEDEVFNGNGAAQMLGILNSAAAVSVAKEAAQAAATVVSANITRMLSRLDPRSRKTAAWFYDPTVEQQLPLMTIGDQPMYIPQGGLRGALDFGILCGLPCFPVEYLAVLGTVGDIMLADMSQYVAIEKGPKTAQSMHARFVNDEQVIKFTTRNDGAPLWKSPITPKNGGPTRSPFVTLATRA